MPKENVGIANMETPEKHDGGHRGGRRGGRGGGKRHGSFTGGRRRFNDALHFPNGGTLEDPLNLNGYMSGEDHTPTEEDMKPIEVVIPRNPRDPLNLSTPQSDKKNRKRKNADNAPAPDPNAIVSPVPKPKQRRCSSPLPGKKEDKPATSTDDEAAKKRKAKKDYFNQKYCYGNFDRYYGTRLQPGETDQRLSILKKEWFEKRTVLDIGCNVGFLTLSIAKTYQPRRILGIDIDEHLVGVARKNIRHYCDDSTEMAGKFPASFSSQFGPASQLPGSYSTKFPDNVWFRKEDYVLDCDEHVDAVTEEFDVILALSITKWIHLNYGDDGMRRFFKRAFAHLHPGGRLIIEPQPFSTYKKRSNMTDTLKKNFKEIEFKPEDFEMYLLNECGFERVEHLGVPEAKSKGFERPIDMYVKRPPKFMQKKEKKAPKEKEQKDEEKPVEEEQEKHDATGQSEGELPTPMES